MIPLVWHMSGRCCSLCWRGVALAKAYQEGLTAASPWCVQIGQDAQGERITGLLDVDTATRIVREQMRDKGFDVPPVPLQFEATTTHGNRWESP